MEPSKLIGLRHYLEVVAVDRVRPQLDYADMRVVDGGVRPLHPKAGA